MSDLHMATFILARALRSLHMADALQSSLFQSEEYARIGAKLHREDGIKALRDGPAGPATTKAENGKTQPDGFGDEVPWWQEYRVRSRSENADD